MKLDPRLHQITEEQPYPLLFATVSGAHLYGFASQDSDWDLRGVHVLPAQKVVGLSVKDETIEVSSPPDEEGFELDLVTHDLKKFLNLLLKRNGYVLEQILSPLIVQTTAEHEELKEIVPRCITRHHAHHYLGFAHSQWKLFAKESPHRVKPLLYVFRVLATGIHLMRTGEIEANLSKLNQSLKLSYIDDLLQQKIHGAEKEPLEGGRFEFFEEEYQRLLRQLVEERDRSELPAAPAAQRELDDFLVRVRLEGFR